MSTKNQKITVSFTPIGAAYCRMAAKMSGVKLIDRTVEIGHYDRESYATTQEGWDKIHVIMTAARSVATGTDKRSLTAAMSRIWTTESMEKERAEFIARREARRAARQA